MATFILPGIGDRGAELVRGVAMFRRLLNEAIAAIERGENPPGTIRDPADKVIVVPLGNEVIVPTS
ncbi:MAG: hypothetical protein ACPGPC_13875 [Alphaproteobacteria bacterium]